jgi:lipopolysaccharide biosynthesis regulator YciM
MEQTTPKKKFNRLVFETTLSITNSEKNALYFYKKLIRHPDIVTYKRLCSHLKDLTEQEIKNDLTSIIKHFLKEYQEHVTRTCQINNATLTATSTLRGLFQQLMSLENQFINIQKILR